MPPLQEPADFSPPSYLEKAFLFPLLREPSVFLGFTQGYQFPLSSNSIILSEQTEARKPCQNPFMWQGSTELVICSNGGRKRGKIPGEKQTFLNFN